ncbi:MAG: hypothetical protein NT118_02110 [Lentisphaerae bacterium]|nr:hypothetical protein [Lentisphaerota bacterium]
MSALYNIFKINKRENILPPGKLGIFNGKLTIKTPYDEVLSFNKLIAPPYICSEETAWDVTASIFQGRCYGEIIRATKYVWHPFMIERDGIVRSIKIKSKTVLADSARTVLITFDMENIDSKQTQVPLQFIMRGVCLDYVNFYDFGPAASKKACQVSNDESGITVFRNDSGAIVFASNIPGLVWQDYSSLWETKLHLEAKEKKTFCITISIGSFSEAKANSKKILSSWKEEIVNAKESWQKKTADLFNRLPQLESDNSDLVCFYNRSLLPLLLNRWEVDEFALNPYYSTGGLNGGCLSSYLWDYGPQSKMWPLFDPESLKNHIKQFLAVDLTSHYSFNPVDGKAIGPWYPINQSLIISLIYHYAVITGDHAFLKETFNDKTVLEWVFFHAVHKDDITSPVDFIDYGTGGSQHHLELRTQHRYDNCVPDLNGRRYLSYKQAHALHMLSGQTPPVNLLDRAEKLKILINDKMWDKKKRWFAFINTSGNKLKEFRYTNLIFELFGTGVLYKEQEQGLLKHLNNEEFLSDYGMHSISKKDPAYNQIDIDQGGGGSCSSVLPCIIERIYKAGYTNEADNILKRILWWGSRLPYMTDSQVANYMAAREDSPLINGLGAITGAQCVIWGLLGLEISPELDLFINPKPTKLAQKISLKGLKIRNTKIDVSLSGNYVEVKSNGAVFSHKTGKPVIICSLK